MIRANSCPSCGADWTRSGAVSGMPFDQTLACHVNEEQPDPEGIEVSCDEPDVHLKNLTCTACKEDFASDELGFGIWLLA